MAVRLVQYLCPYRHCVVAGAYEAGRGTEAGTITSLREMMEALGVEERCALCGSTELKFEDALTKYQTLDEAQPHLAEIARQNLWSRAALDRLLKRNRN